MLQRVACSQERRKCPPPLLGIVRIPPGPFESVVKASVLVDERERLGWNTGARALRHDHQEELAAVVIHGDQVSRVRIEPLPFAGGPVGRRWSNAAPHGWVSTSALARASGTPRMSRLVIVA